VLRRRFHRSERLYLILYNFSPHHHSKAKTWTKENNMELVFTPTYASWLNRIECHFGPLRKFVLEGSDFRHHKDLASAILREQNKIPPSLCLVEISVKLNTPVHRKKGYHNEYIIAGDLQIPLCSTVRLVDRYLLNKSDIWCSERR
jgi:hypothetical protein